MDRAHRIGQKKVGSPFYMRAMRNAQRAAWLAAYGAVAKWPTPVHAACNATHGHFVRRLQARRTKSSLDFVSFSKHQLSQHPLASQQVVNV